MYSKEYLRIKFIPRLINTINSQLIHRSKSFNSLYFFEYTYSTRDKLIKSKQIRKREEKIETRFDKEENKLHYDKQLYNFHIQ